MLTILLLVTTTDAQGQNPNRNKNESIYGKDRYVSRSELGFKIPELIAPTTAMDEIGNGGLPANLKKEVSENQQALPEGFDRGQAWQVSSYNWYAPNTYSYPRYFEDAMLERHGHQCGSVLQPLVSGARFFATIPMLPYLMTIRHPCECEYSLGHYRSGSCAPVLLQRPPFQLNAALAEAGIIGIISGL